jgi:hypothetical protein
MIIYIYWILYNGINEGFKGTLAKVVSYIGLVLLPGFNSILLKKKIFEPGLYHMSEVSK